MSLNDETVGLLRSLGSISGSAGLQFHSAIPGSEVVTLLIEDQPALLALAGTRRGKALLFDCHVLALDRNGTEEAMAHPTGAMNLFEPINDDYAAYLRSRDLDYADGFQPKHLPTLALVSELIDGRVEILNPVDFSRRGHELAKIIESAELETVSPHVKEWFDAVKILNGRGFPSLHISDAALDEVSSAKMREAAPLVMGGPRA